MKKTQLVFGKFYCLVIFGPPNVGKGTQGPKIAAKYGLGYVSTGDIFRSDAYKGKTFLSSHLSVEDVEKLKQYLANENKIPVEEVIIEESVSFGEVIAAGVLIPDSVATPALMEEIMRHATEDGIVIDGYPRTDAQAISLDEHLMSIGAKVDKVIKLDATEDELNTRRAERFTKEQRDDDSVESNARRMREYFDKTVHVIPYYEKDKKVVSINGIGEIEAVFSLICEVVDADVVKVEETSKALKEKVEGIVSETKTDLTGKFEELKGNGPEFFLVEVNKEIALGQFTTGDAQQMISNLLNPVDTVELDGKLKVKENEIKILTDEKSQKLSEFTQTVENADIQKLLGIKLEFEEAKVNLDSAQTLFDDEVTNVKAEKYEGDIKNNRPFVPKESNTIINPNVLTFLFWLVESFMCIGIIYGLTRSGDETINVIAAAVIGAVITFISKFGINLSYQHWDEGSKGKAILSGLSIMLLGLMYYRSTVNISSGSVNTGENMFAAILNLVFFIGMVISEFKSKAKSLNQEQYDYLVGLWNNVKAKQAIFDKKNKIYSIADQQQKNHAAEKAGKFDSSSWDKKIASLEKDKTTILKEKGAVVIKFNEDNAFVQKAITELQKLENEYKQSVNQLFSQKEKGFLSGSVDIFKGTSLVLMLMMFFLMSCGKKQKLNVGLSIIADITDTSVVVPKITSTQILQLLRVDPINKPIEEFTPQGMRKLYVTCITHAATEEESEVEIDLLSSGVNPDLKKEAIDASIPEVSKSIKLLNKEIKGDSSSLILSALLRSREALDSTYTNRVIIIASDGIEFQKGKISMYKPWKSDSLLRQEIQKKYDVSMPSWKGYTIYFVYPYNTSRYAEQAERASNFWKKWIEEQGGLVYKKTSWKEASLSIQKNYQLSQ